MLSFTIFTFLMCLATNFTQSAESENESESDPIFECLDTENVTVDNAIEFVTKNVTLAESIPDLKCYAACLLEGMNALEDNCTFLPESAKRYVSDKGLRKDMLSAYDACHNSTISLIERCECGYQIFKCVSEHMNVE